MTATQWHFDTVEQAIEFCGEVEQLVPKLRGCQQQIAQDLATQTILTGDTVTVSLPLATTTPEFTLLTLKGYQSLPNKKSWWQFINAA